MSDSEAWMVFNKHSSNKKVIVDVRMMVNLIHFFMAQNFPHPGLLLKNNRLVAKVTQTQVKF